MQKSTDKSIVDSLPVISDTAIANNTVITNTVIADTAIASTIVTINSVEDAVQHIEQLIAIEPRFLPIYERLGVPDLRRNAGGFSQLMRAMVGQQLSVAAANSIWNKLYSAKLTTPSAITNTGDEQLRANGLSRQKIRYLRSLAEHNIDFETLKTLPDSQVMDTLTAVVGIGNWTAEMYLLFSLGRADVLAVDDLALKVAMMNLLDLEARPTPKKFRQLTQIWSPYRSTASLLLWLHYDWLKSSGSLKS